MAAWTLISGWFLINCDLILEGGTMLCYCGNILLCMKRNERKPRMHQWRLLLPILLDLNSGPIVKKVGCRGILVIPSRPYYVTKIAVGG